MAAEQHAEREKERERERERERGEMLFLCFFSNEVTLIWLFKWIEHEAWASLGIKRFLNKSFSTGTGYICIYIINDDLALPYKYKFVFFF